MWRFSLLYPKNEGASGLTQGVDSLNRVNLFYLKKKINEWMKNYEI